jgi:hypothetical protein
MHPSVNLCLFASILVIILIMTDIVVRFWILSWHIRPAAQVLIASLALLTAIIAFRFRFSLHSNLLLSNVPAQDQLAEPDLPMLEMLSSAPR